MNFYTLYTQGQAIIPLSCWKIYIHNMVIKYAKKSCLKKAERLVGLSQDSLKENLSFRAKKFKKVL